MKVEISNRENIIETAKVPFPPNTALISITAYWYDFADLENKPDYLLQLKFNDVNNEVLEEAINDEQAEEIAAFIMTALSKADILICQCDYGASRSAGIAAAVWQFLSDDSAKIFTDKRYAPNKLVLRKVLAALEKGK